MLRVPLVASLVELATGSVLRVALVVVAVAHRRLGPNLGRTSTLDRAGAVLEHSTRCWSRPTTPPEATRTGQRSGCSALTKSDLLTIC
jgi:hypothetical protein